MRRHKLKLAQLSLFALTFFVCQLFFINVNPAAFAASFANSELEKVWNRTDKQVAAGSASRTWLWGPEPFTAGLIEEYSEAPGGKRLVQYFDKSRMEITNPNGDKNSQYYVTNGLIAKELMSGRAQLGDNKFVDKAPAVIGVAGDTDDKTGPTYAALNRVAKPAANDEVGVPVAGFIDREGNVDFDKGDYGNKWKVSYAYYEPTTKQNIAGPFWSFLTQEAQVLNGQGQPVKGKLFDPVFYATGLPITGAYWAQVKVGGEVKDVLIQAFERRVLTFTPTNAPAYQVEMGNIGRHYYEWRYSGSQPVVATPGASTPAPTTTPVPTTTTPAPAGVPAVGCLPAISSGTTVQACVSNSTPSKNTYVTVYSRLVINGSAIIGAPMVATWYYKTSNPICEGTSEADGVAKCSRNTGGATSGFTVKIVTVFNYGGQNYRGETSFTTN